MSIEHIVALATAMAMASQTYDSGSPTIADSEFDSLVEERTTSFSLMNKS